MEKVISMVQGKSRLNSFKNSYLSYFMMYTFYYLSWSLFSALISVYLMDQGYTASQVSLVVSASFLTSMIAQPLIGSLCDRYGAKTVNMTLFGLAALGSLLFLMANSLLSVMVGYSFVMMIINGANPIMEKLATASPYAYGRIRIWGTAGYAVGSQLAGILYDSVAPRSLFIVFVFTMALCLLGLWGTEPGLAAPASGKKKAPKKSNESKNGFLTLIQNRQYVVFLLISAVFCGITNVVHTFLPALLQSKGLEMSSATAFLSLAVLCEAPLVLFSSKFMDRLSNKTLMMTAAGLCMGQLLIYALVPGLPASIGITLLAKHPAGMLFIMINLKAVSTVVPSGYQLTALAFIQTARNLMSILFQNLGGALIDQFSYETFFLICFGIMLLLMVIIIFFRIAAGPKEKLFS